MRRIAVSFVLAVVVGACSEDPPGGSSGTGGPDGGSSSDRVTVTRETLDVAGTSRVYVLAVPKSYDEKKEYPLVLVFHGDGGDGPGMREAHTIDALSGDDAIVAYPTGQDLSWNLYEPSETNADMKLVDALVDHLSSKYAIDRGMVFGVGYSSGGYFINQVACRNNGFFRGIVVHAGGAPNEPQDPEAGIWPNQYTKCKGQQAAPAGGVATLAIHGEEDDPAGGEFVATYWAGLNGCPEPPTRTATKPPPCEAYEGCPADLPVVWCQIPGLGHRIWDKGVQEGWAFIKSLGPRENN